MTADHSETSAHAAGGVATGTIRVPPRHAGTVGVEDGAPAAPATEPNRQLADRVQERLLGIRVEIEAYEASAAQASGPAIALLRRVSQQVAALQHEVDGWARTPCDRSSIQLTCRPTDIVSVVHRAARSLEVAWRDLSVPIDIQATAEPPLIHADPEHLHEACILVLETLTTNDMGRIQIIVTHEGGSVETCFVHHADPASKRVADPASATHDFSAELDVARSVVETHGGALERIHQGFRLTLPATSE